MGLGERPPIGLGEVARVALDGNFGAVDCGVSGQKMRVELGNHFHRQGRWAPPAVVDLGDGARRVDVRRQEVKLPLDGLDISAHGLGALHRVGIAAAIVAQVVAKGDVDIDRNRAIGRVGLVERLYILCRCERREMIGRRIARVARHGHVISFEERRVHASGFEEVGVSGAGCMASTT